MMLRRSMVGGLLVIALAGVAGVGRAEAFDVPPNDGYVTDTAGILTAEQERQLETDLTSYRNATSNEIAVVILKSLGGEPIEQAGLDIGRKWGIGSTKDNGILLVIAYEERLARIEVGYGLEGVVPDIVANGIIEEVIRPKFRQGDYFGCIQDGIVALEKHIGGEYTADRYTSGDSQGGFLQFIVFLAFIVLQVLLSVMARSKSWWLGGVIGGGAGAILTILYSWWLSIPLLVFFGLILDFIVSKAGVSGRRRGGGWWGGGFGGGRGGFGGGGGFGGFGGGSFGGGGATGRL